MGWSTGSISKTVKKATKAVSKTASKVVKGTGNVISNPKKAIGNVTDTYVDAITFGQAKTVNAYTGGGADALKGMYRGNSKDTIRVGVTGAAIYGGGALGGFVVNNAFASGGNVIDAAASFAGTGAIPIPGGAFGGGIIDSIANKFGELPKLANSVASYFDPNFSTEGGYDSGQKSNTPLLIIGGVIFAASIFFILRGKK